MAKSEFFELVGSIAEEIGDDPLNDRLERHLNAKFPADGDVFARLGSLCAEGERDGWLMGREVSGIKFGRIIKPGESAGRLSVDVVRMANVKGPHHVHTTGEIGAIMPISGDPKFDGKGAGWYVYPPSSSHHPTVTDGDAYVLYFLPDGQIEFTGQ